MSAATFDLRMLHAALEAARLSQGLSGAELCRRIGGVAASTIARAADGGVMEADGVLAIVRWLGVAPERFVVPDATARASLLSTAGATVRTDTAKMRRLLDTRRAERSLTWAELSAEVAAPAPSPDLRSLRRGGRTVIATLTAVAAWLEIPIAELTRESDW